MMKKSSPKVARRQVAEKTAARLTELNSCLEFLEKNGHLVRIKTPVSSKHELGGIAKKFEGKKCLLFERVKGSRYPVFLGLLWNRNIVGELFGLPKEEIPFRIAEALGLWQKNKNALPSRILSKGPANEIIEEGVDLHKLPIPVHALKDGGRYLDSSVVVVKNPETGIPNISIHRMMVARKDRLTFLIDPGRHLGAYLDIMENRNKPLPVTIN
ncbi:MAG: UbiD family decarboxylase, partial [Pseudomonadota bacterium]